MVALAVKPQTKSIEESRAEIFAMLDAESNGGVVWDNLDNADKKAFCAIAQIQVSDLSRPLRRINQFDRRKLFMAMKRIESVLKHFESVSFQEFK